jgi:membrane AbrB-like protein
MEHHVAHGPLGVQPGVHGPMRSDTEPNGNEMRSILKETFLKTWPILTTGLVAIPGGLLFDFLRIPLPWMLGPLTVTLLYNALSSQRARWPVHFRNAGLIVIGYSMGRTITFETTQQILANLPGMAAATLLTVLFCLGTGYITHRRTGISLASGVLGSMPGGLAQMIILSEEVRDADVTVVTLMQMTRVLAVVFIVPFVAIHGMAHPHSGVLPLSGTAVPWNLAVLPAILAAPLGAWLAYLLKLPIPFLLGPIFATTAAVLAGCPAPPVPGPLIRTAQLFFGIYMGIVITLESLRRLGKVLPYALGSAVLLVAFTYLVAFGLMVVTPANLLSAFLGTAAGGLAEMGIVALALGADVTFVLSYQLFRLFSILLVMPPLLRRRFKR